MKILISYCLVLSSVLSALPSVACADGAAAVAETEAKSSEHEIHRMEISDTWIDPDLHFRHLYGRSKDFDEVLRGLNCGSLRSMILSNHELLEIHSNAVNEDGSFNVVLLDNAQVSQWVDVETLVEGCRVFQGLYNLALAAGGICSRTSMRVVPLVSASPTQTTRSNSKEPTSTTPLVLSPLESLLSAVQNCEEAGVHKAMLDQLRSFATGKQFLLSDKEDHEQDEEAEFSGRPEQPQAREEQNYNAPEPNLTEEQKAIESQSAYRKTSRDLVQDTINHAALVLEQLDVSTRARATTSSVRISSSSTSRSDVIWDLDFGFTRRFGHVFGSEVEDMDTPSRTGTASSTGSSTASSTGSSKTRTSAITTSTSSSLTWQHMRNFATQLLGCFLDRVTQHVTLKSLPFFNLGDHMINSLPFLFNRVDIQYDQRVFGFRFDVLLYLAEKQILKKVLERNGSSAKVGEKSEENFLLHRRRLYGVEEISKTEEDEQKQRLQAQRLQRLLKETKIRVAEVGVEKGETMRYLLQKLGRYIEYYAVVDPYWMDGKPSLDAVLEYYSQNVTAACEQHNRDYQHSPCQMHRVNSLDYTLSETEEHFDLIFLDADHSFESVSGDIAHYASMLKQGGIIAGHDFSKDHLQVVLAVLAHCARLETATKIRLRLGMETVWWIEREGW
ncbi:unnamed protein product [Amoebophrya sp. A25]|nr:unnamed protein product [Amoebophrya sp. A25]|eukprot:GSA25T00024837001.1